MGDYLSLQNMIEVLMISLSVAFFAIEHIMDNDTGTYSGVPNKRTCRLLNDGKNILLIYFSGTFQGHFLGWSLFLAWFDFTMFLGRFDLFGKHIYR